MVNQKDIPRHYLFIAVIALLIILLMYSRTCVFFGILFLAARRANLSSLSLAGVAHVYITPLLYYNVDHVSCMHDIAPARPIMDLCSLHPCMELPA